MAQRFLKRFSVFNALFWFRLLSKHRAESLSTFWVVLIAAIPLIGRGTDLWPGQALCTTLSGATVSSSWHPSRAI